MKEQAIMPARRTDRLIVDAPDDDDPAEYWLAAVMADEPDDVDELEDVA